MQISVTARLALLAGAVAILSNLTLLAFLWVQIHDDAMGELRRDAVEQSDALYSVYAGGGIPALKDAIEDARALGDNSLIAEIVDADGKRQAGYGPPRFRQPRLRDTAFMIDRFGIGPPTPDLQAGIIIRRIGDSWLINGRQLDDWQQAQRQIERALLMSVIISVTLGVVGGLVLTRYVTRRIDRIAGVVDAVSDGDLSRRVALVSGGRDVFDRLSEQLNAMLEKIERLMGELRIVTDGLAHDLRSPLARLRSRVEVALTQSDPAQRDAALMGLLPETDLVMRMLTTLIEITRSESATRDHFTDIAPADLVEAVAELYAPFVEEAGLRFALVIADRPPALPQHRELLSQALTNLIDNAMRHAAEGGEVTLTLSCDADALRYQVADRGAGIADGDKERARRRFGRLDSARTVPGAGLGLALVEAVARLHGGRLALDDNRPGLIASIVLPVAPSPGASRAIVA